MTQHNNPHWAKQKERGSKLGIAALLFFYRYLGTYLTRFVLWFIILYFFVCSKKARHVSRQYLEKVYRHSVTSSTQGLIHPPTALDSLRHFFNFADAILDKFSAWLGHIQLNNVDYHNREYFLQLIHEKKGGLILGSHLGNLEICRALSQSTPNLKMTILVFTQHATKINSMLQSIHPNVQMNLMQVTDIGPDTAVHLKQKIDEGEFVVIVGDRTSIQNANRVCDCQFLGDTAPIAQGPFILAHLLECPIYFLIALKIKGRYHIYFEDFNPPVKIPRQQRQLILQQLTQKYADRLAHYCLKAPFQWFNFFDFWQKTPTQK